MPGLHDFLRPLSRSPMERKLYSIIEKENVMDEGFEPAAIQPNEDYFTIRLCEMNLANSREYFSQYLPMAILVSDFKYDLNRQTVPFLVDNKMLGLESHVEGETIAFKNTRVAGPVPYLGDDVALFTGLFRLEASNIAKSLFNLCESLVKTFDPCGLSQYLAIAKSLGQSLPAVLGMEECQFRLGARDVYSEIQGSENRFRQNYIAYINCPEQTFVPGDLWVKGNRLFSGTSSESASPVKDYDHCLIKIERSDTRSDYTTFGFYALWKEAHNLLIENAFEKAQIKKIEFLQQINSCPDLTEAHKEELIQLFHLRFDHLLNRQKAIQGAGGPGFRGSAKRGKEKTIHDKTKQVGNKVTTFLQSSATLADNLDLPSGSRVGDSLNRLKNTWKKIPLFDNPEDEFDRPGTSCTNGKDQDGAKANHEINQQLAILREERQQGTPDPSGFVQALALTTFKQ